MHLRVSPWVAAAVLLTVMAFTATGQAQEDEEGITYCGEERHGIQFRNNNPDLNPWNDPIPEDHAYRDSDAVPEVDPGIIESSWQLFSQAQLVVDTDHPDAPPLDPEKDGGIKSWWFGFGPLKDTAVIDEMADCEKPWVPGIQFYSYRSDATPENGFFVPINTTGVSDGTYGFVVYACTERTYDACQPAGVDEPESGEPVAQDNFVAAAWGKSTVYNGREHCEEGGLEGTPFAHHDPSCMRGYDFVKPWPMILPGDGSQTNEDACDVPPDRCLTIEFTEHLATGNGTQAPNGKAIRLWFNGIERTAELAEWTPPPRDNDLIPGNDGPHTGHPASDCQHFEAVQENMPPDARLCQKVVWGDGFTWEAPQAFSSQDEFTVWAKDGAGNTVEKVISLEDVTRGGVIPLIEADVNVTITPDAKEIRPGDAKTFTVHAENRGNDTVHTFPKANGSEGIETTLTDDHVDIEGGSNRTVKLQVAPGENATEGEHGVSVVFEYISGQRRLQETAFATVVVDADAEPSSNATRSSGGDANGTGAPSGATPGEDFERTCTEQADMEVCSVYPSPLRFGEEFTYEVDVQRAGEDVEQRHEFSAGNATLRFRYLDEDRDEEVTLPTTYRLTEVGDGVYRADVTIEERAPYVVAVFDSEKVKVRQVIKRPVVAQDEGAAVPASGPLVSAAAAGAALVLSGRKRREG